MSKDDNKQHVGVRLDKEIVSEIEESTKTKSEFIRIAVREKLGRPSPHRRLDRVERKHQEDIDDLQSQITEMRSALIKASQSGYGDYEPTAGDFLDDNG